MAIKIVMGPSCAGKSHFIKETFPNSKVIDLWDFQKDYHFVSYDIIMKSYIDTKNALIEAIKNKEDVVLEHTLLKAIRREMYVKAIKEITDEPINIYVILPDKENFKLFNEKRGFPCNDSELEQMLNILEIPTLEEGFENIYIITPKIKRDQQ